MNRPSQSPSSSTARLPARVLLLVLIIGPLTVPFYLAGWDPQVNFLRPSSRASWVVDPRWERRAGIDESEVRTVFERRFDGKPQQAGLSVSLWAFRRATMILNGREINLPTPASWKAPLEVDLTGFLSPQQNHLQILVENGSGPPALLVTEPAELATPKGWTFVLPADRERLKGGPDAHFAGDAVSTAEEAVMAGETALVLGRDPGPLQRFAAWSLLRWLLGFWLLWLVILGLWLGWRANRFSPGQERVHSCPRFLSLGVPATLLLISLLLNLWNAHSYPAERSPFDWAAHADYVRQFSRQWRVPLPSEGFETFQPPSYYFTAAILYRLAGGEGKPERALKAVQYAGSVCSWLLGVLGWMYARRFFPSDWAAQWLAVCFAAFLPMVLYMGPLITNEVFAAVAIALALYLLVQVAGKPAVPLLPVAIAGGVCGIALLSKYTAIFTAVSGSALFLSRGLVSKSRRDLQAVFIYAGSILLVCGWFYFRNIQLYGQPFVGNWDESTGFQYEQPPGYRTLGFYARAGTVFLHHPEQAPWRSWLDGNFASMWGDVYRVFWDGPADSSYLWVSVIFVLATLPTLAIVLGFWRTGVNAWKGPRIGEEFVLVAVCTWTWTSLLIFTLELPFASTVKAFFFLSLVPAMSTFLLRGRNLMRVEAPAMRWLLDGCVLGTAALALLLYRYPG